MIVIRSYLLSNGVLLDDISYACSQEMLRKLCRGISCDVEIDGVRQYIGA